MITQLSFQFTFCVLMVVASSLGIAQELIDSTSDDTKSETSVSMGTKEIQTPITGGCATCPPRSSRLSEDHDDDLPVESSGSTESVAQYQQNSSLSRVGTTDVPIVGGCASCPPRK